MFSVRKIIILPLMFSILAATSGCNSSNDEEEVSITSKELNNLYNAKGKWDSQSGQFYTIQSQRLCECVPEMTTQMKITVAENLVLSAYDIVSEEVISKEIQEEIITVDSLFALIEKAIADDISIEVTYNEEHGYPEEVKINLEQLAVDGGLHIRLSDLEIKKSLFALDDLTWSLVSFDSIAGPQPIIDNTNISLSVDIENMQLSGMGGCNSYMADFVLDDKNHDMTISNLTSTQLACSEPENFMQQEQSYFATLQNIQFFTYDKANLNMVVGADSGLHFVVDQNLNVEAEIENPSDELALLLSAKTNWNRHSGQYYTIQSQRFCECADEVSAQMKINVLDNSVLSAFDLNSGEVISEGVQDEILPVDSLFDLIEKAIADGIAIEVTYNEEFGYPELVKIGLGQFTVDGGLNIRLSDLEIKNSIMALDDVTWALESFDSIAGPQPIIENTNISLSVDMDNMQLSGTGGCNNYTADFVLDNKNHNITISNVISTEMACSDPQDIIQQEMSYFATLQQIQFFTFDQAYLNMVVGGDSGLHFVPVKLTSITVD